MVRYITFVLFALTACGLIYEGGVRGAQAYERLLIDRIQQGLAAIDIEWVQVKSNGLRIEVHGHAPSIEAQALAVETARATAPLAHIVDYSSATLTPPPVRDPVRLELHRDQTGIIITGRVSGEAMRRDIRDGLDQIVPDLPVHDLSGDDAAEPGSNWGPELDLAFLAVSALTDAYLTVSPGHVRIEGVVPDAAARDSFGLELVSLAGPDITLSLDLRTPPRAIAPFEFVVLKTYGGLRIESCAARTIAERTKITQLLIRAGAAEHGRSCSYGLGGPDGNWVGAIEAGLAGLALLETGRLKIAYSDVVIDPLQPVEPETLRDLRAAVTSALPAGFSLEERVVIYGDATAAPKDGLWLSLAEQDETFLIEGRVADSAEIDALRLYARARFPSTEVITQIQVVDTAAPEDWHVATLAAIDGLHLIEHGRAEMSPGRMTLSGTTVGPETAGRLHRDLNAALPGFEISTEFTVDVPKAVSLLPFDDQACIGRMNQLITDEPVVFAIGEATIEDASDATLDRLADVYARCGSIDIAIAGHTDSQGAEDYNRRLSQKRADAVMDALIERGIPFLRMSSVGLGESEPLASNETEDGRARNRRIEFRLGG